MVHAIWEKPLCMGDLSLMCKIFIERPVIGYSEQILSAVANESLIPYNRAFNTVTSNATPNQIKNI